jgi:hypothetical protein
LLLALGAAFCLGGGAVAIADGTLATLALSHAAKPRPPRLAERTALRSGALRVAERVAVARSRSQRHRWRHRKPPAPAGPAGPAAPPVVSTLQPPFAPEPEPTPEPEPEPQPEPEPVDPSASSGCFSSPHSCGFPDPTNTGVPSGLALKPSGSLTVTRAGTVVSGLQVTGTINVLASNVTIEDTRVTQGTTCGDTSTCGNYVIRIDEAASGTTIRDVETASAAGATCEHDIRNTGGSLTVEGAYLHACDSNVYAAGPTVVEDSYGISKIDISNDHVENIYFNDTSFSAIHDTLLNPVGQTAVVFGNSGGGIDVTNCRNQLTVLDSLLAGGGYTIYPCAHAASAGSSSVNIQGNHFARCVTAESYNPDGGSHPCKGGPDSSGYFAKSGSYGVVTDYFTGAGIWRGNVWDDNLEKVCSDGRSSGCE